MSKDSNSAAAPPDAAAEDYNWQRVGAVLFSPQTLISLVLLAFLATRFSLLMGFEPLISDLYPYSQLARLGVDCGQTAYSDFPIEYPPLAWWLMAAPRLTAAEQYAKVRLPQRVLNEYAADYAVAFRHQLMVADLLCLVMAFLVGGLISPAARWVLPAAYTAISYAQPHLLYDRLDIVLCLFLLLSVYCWLRSLHASAASDRWAVASYLLLGFGFSFKIVPILMAPFLLLADWRAAKSWSGMAVRVVALTVAAIGPFLIQMLSAGWSVLRLFQYHSERHIHMESIWGSLLLAARELGIPCARNTSHGSFNLVGPWEPAMKIAAIVSAVAAAAGLGLWAILRGRRFDRRTALDCGYLVLVNSTVLATVFSPQYLDWLLPVSLLLALDVAGRHWTTWSVLLALMAAIVGISAWIFPHHYGGPSGLVNLGPLSIALSEIRSACLVALAVLLNIRFFVSARSEPPAAGAIATAGRDAAA